MKKMTYISLFSSAGVGCYGFLKNNFECIATCEILEKRINVQKLNKKCKKDSGYICGNVLKNEVKQKIFDEIKKWKKEENLDVDVVIATPPCQGMSTANFKKNNEMGRNSLVLEAIELVKKIEPKIFVFENVKSFLKTKCIDKKNEEKTIEKCIDDNLKEKFNIYKKIINFKEYGVPSSRPRTLVIGTRKDLVNITPLNIFPQSQKIVTIKDAISQLPKLDWGEKATDDQLHFFRTYPEYMKEWVHQIKQGESAFKGRIKPYKIVDGKKIVLKGENLGNKFRRMEWEKPAPCIHTRNDQIGSQSTIHPEQDRVLSIRELMKVMSIPDSFMWTENNNFFEIKNNENNIRQCIGEAVPTKIFYEIAKNIKEMLDYDFYAKFNKKINNKNFFINSLEYERKIINKKETGSFFTPQVVIYNALKKIKINKKSIKILEPAVGTGNFLPQIFKIVDDCSSVEIDVYDISIDALKHLKKNIKNINYNKQKIKINYFNEDFTKANIQKKYDIIISNPPFLKNTKINNGTKSKINLFAMFLEKFLSLSEEICVLVPKSFLMSPEFNKTRKKYEEFNIVSICDYGVGIFKNVFIEIVSIHFNKTYLGKTYVENIKNNSINTANQKYFFHEKSWLIYRNEWFDAYIKKMELGVFDFFRDRQITNKYLKKTGKIWVVKSKNILSTGDVVPIKGYDKYIEKISNLTVSKFLNKNCIIMPNFTYNTRAAYLPKNTVPNGSIAVMEPKKHDKKYDLSFYSTPDFKKYYSIVKNNSKFTLNIDKNSVYYIGVPNENK